MWSMVSFFMQSFAHTKIMRTTYSEVRVYDVLTFILCHLAILGRICLLSLLLLLTFDDGVKAYTVRQWWVYLSPNEAKQLYQSPQFSGIKANADSLYLSGIKSPRGCLKSNTLYERELRAGLEVLSSTYAGLKWGKYKGSSNPELLPYLTTLTSDWKDVIATGPASLWTDSRSAGCVGNVGWNEGDIALRDWIVGALPSYDAIRDDISSEERTIIDGWFRDVANKEMAAKGYPLWHNRGVSRAAQAHVMALVLQDKALFTSFYQDPILGMNNVIQNFKNQPSSNCSFFPYRPGLGKEHSYKSGIYGRAATSHTFQALMIISHAARTGGYPAWDITNTPDQALLNSILDTWYDYGGVQRTQYIDYANCLERNWKNSYKTVDTDLKEDFWVNFAYLQPRFLAVKYWNKDSTVANIWRIRSIFLNNLSSNKVAFRKINIP